MVKRLEMNHKGLPEFDENGTWVFFSDYHTMQQKLHAIAAENAALKSSIPNLKHIDLDNDNMDDVSLAEDIGFNDAVTLMNRWKGETPATDAYLNSVRAEGLKMAIDHMNNQTSDDCADVTVLPVIEMYKKLISGTHDTAHKAG